MASVSTVERYSRSICETCRLASSSRPNDARSVRWNTASTGSTTATASEADLLHDDRSGTRPPTLPRSSSSESHGKCCRQIWNGDCPTSRPTATAIRPGVQHEVDRRSTRRAARMSGPIGASIRWRAARRRRSGRRRAPATHSDSAGATVLKATRVPRMALAPRQEEAVGGERHRRGPGPNSSADAMKNVSATEMLASTDAMLSVNEPVRIASAANRNHASGCGTAAAAPRDA